MPNQKEDWCNNFGQGGSIETNDTMKILIQRPVHKTDDPRVRKLGEL